jgi:Domain of unknown function (DUF1996)
VPRALLVAAFLLALVLPGAGAASGRASAGKPPSRVVNFLAHCGVSRFGRDDPIVYPGQPGRSHHHTFFGSRAINAHATPASLRAASTTCGRKSETAAYWVPTLFRNGRRVTPVRATAYYTLRRFSGVRPYPASLKMIAGDADVRRPQPLGVVWWSCGPFSNVRRSSSVPPRCPPRSGPMGARLVFRTAGRTRNPEPSLQLHVRFPDCWDGRRLDSPDHKAHMAYQSAGECPGSHPVRVPSLILIVVYPIRAGDGVALASGGQYSGHADFINAWDQKELSRIVTDCSQARPRCARK